MHKLRPTKGNKRILHYAYNEKGVGHLGFIGVFLFNILTLWLTIPI